MTEETATVELERPDTDNIWGKTFVRNLVYRTLKNRVQWNMQKITGETGLYTRFSITLESNPGFTFAIASEDRIYLFQYKEGLKREYRLRLPIIGEMTKHLRAIYEGKEIIV